MKFPDFLLERGDGKIEVIIDFGQNEYRVVVPRLNKLTAYIDSVSETTVSGWLSRFGPKSGSLLEDFYDKWKRSCACKPFGTDALVCVTKQQRWYWAGIPIELETNDIVKACYPSLTKQANLSVN